jgi:hypothetical protein
VKVVFVAGFFNRVQKFLESKFQTQIQSKQVIWIKQSGIQGAADIRLFKERFFDRLTMGADDVLVLLAILRGKEWIKDKYQSIIDSASQRFPDANVALKANRNAQDIDFVASELKCLESLPIQEISIETVRKRLGTDKILCICSDKQPQCIDVLKRAGFAPEVYIECFVEERIKSGTNSNLIAHLCGKATSYKHMLYAWGGGLRTLPPDVKRQFIGYHYEGPQMSGVISAFKDWILSG